MGLEIRRCKRHFELYSSLTAIQGNIHSLVFHLAHTSSFFHLKAVHNLELVLKKKNGNLINNSVIPVVRERNGSLYFITSRAWKGKSHKTLSRPI